MAHSRTLVDRDGDHLWHPFTQQATAPPPLPVAKADGAWLELTSGRRVLDAVSSWWTINHGHRHPAIMRAIRAQLDVLDHVLLAGVTHPLAVEVAERLAAKTPGDLNRVFFSDNGSTAVEVALKMAWQYQQNVGQGHRRRFAALRGGYHGDTVGAMSVGDPTDYHGAFDGLTFDVVRFESPSVSGDPRTSDDPFDLASLEDLFVAHGDALAAVIVEPMVQGAGGMRMQPPAFLQRLSELCRGHGVLFIADEVMTGFGRTGRVFACEHAGVVPDLMAVAKGLTGGAVPLSATVATPRIYEAFLSEDPRRAFLHGHSFTGNPIGCAAACASLKLFDDEPVLERVAALEAVYARRLPDFLDLHGVKEIRYLGGIGVVELESPSGSYFDRSKTGALRQAFVDAGYLVRPLGPVVYFMPPFCTTPAELGRLLDVAEGLLE